MIHSSLLYNSYLFFLFFSHFLKAPLPPQIGNNYRQRRIGTQIVLKNHKLTWGEDIEKCNPLFHGGRLIHPKLDGNNVYKEPVGCSLRLFDHYACLLAPLTLLASSIHRLANSLPNMDPLKLINVFTLWNAITTGKIVVVFITGNTHEGRVSSERQKRVYSRGTR